MDQDVYYRRSAALADFDFPAASHRSAAVADFLQCSAAVADCQAVVSGYSAAGFERRVFLPRSVDFHSEEYQDPVAVAVGYACYTLQQQVHFEEC